MGRTAFDPQLPGHGPRDGRSDGLRLWSGGASTAPPLVDRLVLDLAVLVEGYAEPVALWQLASDLAEAAGCDVDLLDLRRASTVMQHQVLTRGERWWAADVRAGLFECAVLGEKLELDRARAGLLSDIRREGRIHGR
ncbi:nucleotidyltransferase domain-containing protein [Luteimonas sp. RC10]|uniref:type VII toxin-antitoxin system MntA family adenylyltransferase antitoxin n=1 Tax=Luteimonas sp. RC10 TaxID=2587035 RepID=UPI00179AA821|nr:nucleotidyltransferase domain-containing protein [Luteimonas sp. RC10]MBB3342492.1 hypothetical protein [Luteimonas sp. RC10]